MDAFRLGQDLRLLRRRKGWTQTQLASAAGTTRWFVSEIERARAGRVNLDVVARLVAALSVRVLFQGEGLDRLRDRAHARLVDDLVTLLTAAGWEVATEVSFNEYGERGSIDVLAFHPATGSLLVVEVKTVVPDVGGMLMTLDRKVRLASRIAAARGWDVRTVSRLLAFPERRTVRRRVLDHAATFAVGFPSRSAAVRRWIRRPVGPLAGLLFLSDAGPGRTR
jgi:transcriptional regulator with XRE-family HTH domain